MGVLESTCPTCGAKIVVVFHDRSLETLMVEKTCACPSAKAPSVVSD